MLDRPFSVVMDNYTWGDRVWVETHYDGRKEGIVLGWNPDGYVVSIIGKNEHEYRADYPASHLSPRDDGPRPGKWRLPEPGDTIRVIKNDVKYLNYIGREFKVQAIDWEDEYPIVMDDGSSFDLTQIELVRLHDGPEVTEPEGEPNLTTKATMLTTELNTDITSRIGRVVVVSYEGSSYHSMLGKVIRETDDRTSCQVRFLNNMITTIDRTDCELLPEDAVEYFDRMMKKLSDPETWDTSGKLTPLSEIRARRQTMEDTMHDPVNHPSHYRRGGIEVIDFLEAFLTPDQFEGYLLGTQLAYNSRANWKGSMDEDLRKAEWYQKRLVAFREKRKASQ